MVKKSAAKICEVIALGTAFSRAVASRKCCHFMTIAAKRHGTPAAAVCAGIVIEEKAAGGIGAKAHARCFAFGNKLGGGTRDRGKKPIEATLSCYIFDSPGARSFDEFIVTFSNTQDFVDGLYPFARDVLFPGKGFEREPEGIAQPLCTIEEVERGLRG